MPSDSPSRLLPFTLPPRSSGLAASAKQRPIESILINLALERWHRTLDSLMRGKRSLSFDQKSPDMKLGHGLPIKTAKVLTFASRTE